MEYCLVSKLLNIKRLLSQRGMSLIILSEILLGLQEKILKWYGKLRWFVRRAFDSIGSENHSRYHSRYQYETESKKSDSFIASMDKAL